MGNGMNKEKKLVQLYLAKDKWDLLKTAADSVDEPITVWIRRAIFGALRNWDAPTLKKANWPKCTVCGKKHDEQEHYSLGEV